MADKAPKHPEKDQLLAFGMGRLEADEAGRIAQHLDQCADCSETIVNLQDDTFVSLVRSSPAPTPVDEAELEGGGSPASLPEVTVDVGSDLSGDAEGQPADLPPELRDHRRYEILELIGRGGMGDVYKAQHKVMNRVVALKVIKPELVRNNAAVERFRREVQAAARLHHGNIVTAFDAEQAGSLHYLVMEFVDGVNFDEVVRERDPLTIDEACKYIRQAAEGLQHAHEHGMVHRDIKPHNLMLTSSGEVKILDFGLANLASEIAVDGLPDAGESKASEKSRKSMCPESRAARQLTHLGTMMGTPDYIAPEQAEDAHTADIRADIYSLGCTFYTLLAGQSPFAEGSVMDKIKAHTEQDAPPLSDFRDDVPAEVEAILQKMMAKDPAERYQTPAQVAEALAKFARPRRRSRIRTLVAAAVAALLFLAATVFYIQQGKTTIKFEVDDPSLAIRFAGDTIAVENDGQTIHIEPGQERKFVVEQNGLEVETDSFTLKKGQKVVLRVTLVDGKVAVLPSDPALRIPRIPYVPREERFEKLQSDGATDHANVVTKEERSAGWRALFDGRSLDGWYAVAEQRTAGRWFIEDGWLTTREQSNLVTEDLFDHFELRFEWKVATGGAGGAMYRYNATRRPRSDIYPHYQLLDNAGHEDGKEPRTSATGLYGVFAPSRDVTRPVGQINEGRIVCFGPHVEHWLNGEKVLEYDRSGDEFLKALEHAIDAIKKDDYAGSDKGKIVLRATSGRVWFRNLKLRPLTPDGSPDLSKTDIQPDPRGLELPPAEMMEIGRYTGHNAIVTRIVFAPDNQHVLSISDDQTVQYWDFFECELIHKFDGGGMLRAAAIAPQGEMAATGGLRRIIHLWNLKTGEPAGELVGHKGRIQAVQFMPDGRRLASTSGDGTLRIWDLESKQELKQFHTNQKYCYGLAVSPNGKWIACQSAEQTLLVNTDKWEERTLPLKAAGFAFSPDSRLLAIGQTLWDVERGEQVRTFPRQAGGIRNVHFMPDQRHVLFGSDEDKSLRLWNVETGREVAQARCNSFVTTHVALSPDGRYVASGGGYRVAPFTRDGDHIIRCWQFPESVWPDTGWMQLFNGKDLTGWKTHPNQPDGWSVEDGVLIGRGNDRSHLFSERGDFEDFHLRAEVKINDTGNSGIFFRSGFGLPNGGRYPDGYEAQILNGKQTLGDGTPETQLTGSLYNLKPFTERRAKPDEWFTLDVIAQGNHITIKVNGRTSVDYVDSEKTYRKGHIALQVLGHTRPALERTEIQFRNIKIRPLVDPDVPRPAGDANAELPSRIEFPAREYFDKLRKDEADPDAR